MESGLRDAAKPRRFDLTMSRRTRRPASLATDCRQEDPVLQSVQQPMVQPQKRDQDAELKEQTPAPAPCLCLSDHLQSQQSEDDAHQEHKQTSEQSQDAEEQTTPPQKCVEEEDESEAQQQLQEEECEADSSRRFSLQELIEDEAGGDGVVKDAATGIQEENVAGAVAAVHEDAEAAAEKRAQQVAGRRVIGMVRRYVKIRSIKRKAAPEKNVVPVC